MSKNRSKQDLASLTKFKRQMGWLTTAVVVVIVCLLPGPFTLTHAAQLKECRLQEAGVYVTISAEAIFVNNDTTALRWVEVNWYGVSDAQEGDWVGLWDHDPAGSLDDSLIQEIVSGADGVLRTSETWDDSLIPSSLENTTDSCLPYWAGYVRNGALLHSACLMLRPHWLSTQRPHLSATRLTKVAIPGTHDAGASGYFGLAIIGSLVGRWTFTQDQSLWQQLVLGVRYMDMRIAYYPNTVEKFFVNHDQVRIAPLQPYIDNVVAFMTQTEEIVIFDIHKLPHGFDGYPERHQELIALLEFSFQEWMAPKNLGPDPTMGELWESGSRLIVTYPSSEGSLSPYLWNNVYHLWGDVNTLGDLEAYLYKGIPQQTDRGSLWSVMAEFTPTAIDVAFNHWGGLRGAATITNTPVTCWFRQDWWDQVNIVAMDYIPASDVVSVAVEANKLRGGFCGRTTRISRSGSSSGAELVAPSEARVWLWVSALASASSDGQTTQRQMEINWEVTEVHEGDWVGLFDHEPTQDWLTPLQQAVPEATTSHYLTNYTFPFLPIHANMTEGSCLGWWAAYVRNDRLIATDCIKIHPGWMSSLSEQLSGVALRDLVIPGVHDSGTYTPYTSSSDNSLLKYAITQDESIYNQLVFGQRYIDLRVGYFTGDPEEPYWVVHGLTVWRPFTDVLRQLRDFIQDTGEVVLVEVGGFTFFETSEEHEGCIDLITRELGDLMAPSSHGWDTPLGDLLQSPSSLIVTYNHQEANGSPIFWPNMSGRWANAQTLTGLEEYMVRVFESEGPPSRPWTLSGQLTPLAEDVILDDLGSLRVMADEVNRNVTSWLRLRWWDQINIISCDFTLSAGYVEVAIEVNLKRASLTQV
ncbi:PI-PLC X domain-containing protein 1-like 2 [Homarus americanus]|uniref:PI-PLC X domain-containing protein 1-like 2 n=1 Tax=Homarus americanus TaxID=6706 RepID=A0A8J5MQR0_HOMAM|nr:PI-PLC X domain-containing protein 1-like 2 [Homarus americanus]